MMYKTHFIFAFLISLLLISYFPIKEKLFFITLILVSSFIPDIDNTNSKISKEFKISSFILNKLFSHRGFFHSLLFPLILYFILNLIIGFREIALAIFSGISSHLFLDMLTKDGISLFAPFSNKRIRGFIKTNGLIEKIFFIVLFALVLLSLQFFFNIANFFSNFF